MPPTRFDTFPGPETDPSTISGDWGYVMDSVAGFEPGHIVPGVFAIATGLFCHGRRIDTDVPILVFVADAVVFDAGGGIRSKVVTQIEPGASIQRIQRKVSRDHDAGWNYARNVWQCLCCRSYSPSGECIEHLSREWEVVGPGIVPDPSTPAKEADDR